MFCKEVSKDVALPCSMKLVYEIISFISLICSIFVVSVTIKKIKVNLIHKLILQIIISEMVDEINILLEIISDLKGKLNFENYEFRMHICYTQIFLSAYSCLWTLTASFFISLKLYDLIINKNKIFRYNSFMEKNTIFISISAPIIMSYILWASHVIHRARILGLELMYIDKIKQRTQGIKLIFCWLFKDPSIALVCIVALLIFGNLYFSFFKGYIFLRRIKNKISENVYEQDSNEIRIKNLSKIQSILFLYPIISCIIWIIFFLFIFLFVYSYRDEPSAFGSWTFCIFMTIRQTIYTLVYFLSQKDLRKHAILYLLCKNCKNKNIGNILIPIKENNGNNKDDNNKIFNDGDNDDNN